MSSVLAFFLVMSSVLALYAVKIALCTVPKCTYVIRAENFYIFMNIKEKFPV
jgi:hypothetical protein